MSSRTQSAKTYIVYRDRETGRTSVVLLHKLGNPDLMGVVIKTPLTHRVIVEGLTPADAEHTALQLIYDYRMERDQ
jgi:hypothetical protein